MTLNLISLGRSHQALSTSNITLRLHWVWLWRPFSPTLKSHDRYRKSGRKKILFWSLVSESLVSSHWWSISWDEIDRKFGRILEFGRRVTLNLTLDDLEFDFRWPWILYRWVGLIEFYPTPTLSGPLNFHWVSFWRLFSPISKSRDTWHVIDIENSAREKFYIGP